MGLRGCAALDGVSKLSHAGLPLAVRPRTSTRPVSRARDRPNRTAPPPGRSCSTEAPGMATDVQWSAAPLPACAADGSPDATRLPAGGPGQGSSTVALPPPQSQPGSGRVLLLPGHYGDRLNSVGCEQAQATFQSLRVGAGRVLDVRTFRGVGQGPFLVTQCGGRRTIG